MARADQDIICRDLAGIERLVAFGSDIPAGWDYVREAGDPVQASDADVPRTRGNTDAAATRAERLAGDQSRQEERTTAAVETVPPAPTPDEQVVPIRTAEPGGYEGQSNEALDAEIDRRRGEGREVPIDSTGPRGAVVKRDRIAALMADDAAVANDAKVAEQPDPPADPEA